MHGFKLKMDMLNGFFAAAVLTMICMSYSQNTSASCMSCHQGEMLSSTLNDTSFKNTHHLKKKDKKNFALRKNVLFK
jgi:hypothetical protein